MNICENKEIEIFLKLPCEVNFWACVARAHASYKQTQIFK